MKYRSEIDGLRTFAVVPVIFFHAGVWPFSGGYVGVDIFFVISGYLITTLIVTAIQQGNFSIIDFYERRARRLLPALVVVQLACIPFALIWMVPNQLHDFFQSLVAVNLFGSNLLFWVEEDYFELASELKPLLHTWSLAVEEQFYLIFPLLMLLLIKKNGPLPWQILILCVVLSFVLCLWMVRQSPSTAFYLSPFRAWELGLGSLAAFLLQNHPDFRSELGGVIGFILVCISFFLLDHDTVFPSEWALAPVVGTFLLIVCATSGTATQRFLSWRPFVFVGLISYSAYLWHQPLFAFTQMRFGELSTGGIMVLLAITFILATLSWRFIEQPVRRAPHKLASQGGIAPFASRSSVFAASGTAIFILVAVGLYGHQKEGFRTSFDQINVAGYDWDNLRLQRESWALLRKKNNPHRGPTGDERDNLPTFQNLERVQFLTVGNSLSKDLYNAFVHNPEIQSLGEVERYGIQIASLANQNHRFWTAPNYQNADVIFISSYYSVPDDLADLPATVSRMQSDGKVVAIVGNSPEFWGNSVRTRADDIILPALMHGTTSTFQELSDEANRHFWLDLHNDGQRQRLVVNETLTEIANNNGSIYLDRVDFMCAAEELRCYAVGDDLTKYLYDEHHITMEGAAFYGQRMTDVAWLAPVFLEIAHHF